MTWTERPDWPGGWHYSFRRHAGGRIHSLWSPQPRKTGVRYARASPITGWTLIVNDNPERGHTEEVAVAEVLRRLPKELHPGLLEIHSLLISDAESIRRSWKGRVARFRRELGETGKELRRKR